MINIILFIIEIIFVASFLIVSIVLLPIGYLLRVIDEKKSLTYATSIVKVVFRVIKVISFTSIDVRYDEKLQDDKPYFYIANHRGIFDIILLYPLIKGNCIIISKDKLKKYPLVSHWMELIGCYFLDRDNMRSGFKMVVYSIEMLKKGISVLIFPEGTRSRGEDYRDLLDFKEGCFAIPKKTDTEVVPIAIHDSGVLYEKNKMLRAFQKIYIHIGSACKIDEEDDIGSIYREKVRGLM